MKIKLKEDLIIPKGTEFENCDNTKIEFVDGNFNTMIGTGTDGVVNIYLNQDVIRDNNDKFELIPDKKDNEK